MIVRNFLDAPSQAQSIHGGKGQGKNARVFDKADFDTPLKFINYVELESGATIGAHRHGDNEEVYLVLSGNGVMIVNDERQAVKTGDIILNKPGWEHGLENTGDEPLRLFVFEVDRIRNS
ncbi:MAG: cupin domain-containing protein [Chloroflexi bacterium]|nr:cupin domain-containing protein [Chloroflexota bacterium]